MIEIKPLLGHPVPPLGHDVLLQLGGLGRVGQLNKVTYKEGVSKNVLSQLQLLPRQHVAFIGSQRVAPANRSYLQYKLFLLFW